MFIISLLIRPNYYFLLTQHDDIILHRQHFPPPLLLHRQFPATATNCSPDVKKGEFQIYVDGLHSNLGILDSILIVSRGPRPSGSGKERVKLNHTPLVCTVKITAYNHIVGCEDKSRFYSSRINENNN